MQERRHHPRRAASVRAEMYFEESGVWSTTLTHDLCAGGALFSAIEHVRPDEQVQLTLTLREGTDPLRCNAAVRWSRPRDNGLHFFGLQFVDLSAKDRGKLAAFLALGTPETEVCAV